MTQLARLFRALADTNRLRILNILSHRSLCVCDMQSVLGLPQPFISRHLAYLRRAGLVRDRREGMRVVYSLATQDPCVRSLSKFLTEEFSRHAEFATDIEKLWAEACCMIPSPIEPEEQHEHQNPAL
jgi:ArsR family transcriptional regulator